MRATTFAAVLGAALAGMEVVPESYNYAQWRSDFPEVRARRGGAPSAGSRQRADHLLCPPPPSRRRKAGRKAAAKSIAALANYNPFSALTKMMKKK
jgi:hypothetical protein